MALFDAINQPKIRRSAENPGAQRLPSRWLKVFAVALMALSSRFLSNKVKTMSQFTLPLLGTCACLLLAAAPAFANTACNDHAVITERLANSYGESRHAMGLGRNNTMIEVYSSEESGSWTILVTRPGGPTCMVAAGEAFQVLNEMLAEEEDSDA